MEALTKQYLLRNTLQFAMQTLPREEYNKVDPEKFFYLASGETFMLNFALCNHEKKEVDIWIQSYIYSDRSTRTIIFWNGQTYWSDVGYTGDSWLY